jgi:hypothetical protein
MITQPPLCSGYRFAPLSACERQISSNVPARVKDKRMIANGLEHEALSLISHTSHRISLNHKGENLFAVAEKMFSDP